MPRAPKTCIICMKDCAGDPRVKDRRGRYYHRACFRKMRRELQGVGDGAEQELLRSGPIPEMINDIVSSPPDPAPGTNVCPSCAGPLESQAVLCTRCGYNRVTGQRLATVVEPPAEKESGSNTDGHGFASLIREPWVFGLGLTATYGALFLLAAKWSPYFILAHLALLLLTGAITAARVTRIAFQDGILEGLFTHFLFRHVPFYHTHYVYSRIDNPYLKWANVAGTVGGILLVLWVVLFGIELIKDIPFRPYF